ncbi:YceD family protein [Sulfitobacter guttiformis]|uniref:Uncharacterized protein DUF177 involved in 23S rRNA accumulation n=1 Tax=Sulfitobacter guttiformis TaxID=74349 RepID=A0A420DMV0_9RHOB|nr:DUF177 domain-containing protein [Sulfitobacter guttiformis]KIN72844.1 DUF177 domain containing protein [Sulfitobacter guttiformis KCTC 32187]RKE95535.1 uncharacterized protein DUF177 involved in 23S rRNA accumulation [Sulfitobacter guttiformis]
MSPTPPTATSLRVASLSQTAPTPFSLRPGAPALAAIAEALALSGLRKLSFEGTLRPLGDSDWQLKGRLGATATQPCVVTLEPVVTRIDTDVMRVFIHDYVDIDAPEAEVPEDDSVEPLGAWIDPAQIMEEALALALPEYPRKQEGETTPLRVTEPGKTPMTDEQARPFAGLAAFKQQLEEDNDT